MATNNAINVNAVTPLTPIYGGSGVSAPTAHTLPVAEGSANYTFVGPLTNGQILIGQSGFDPIPATITAGSNITVTNASGSITISVTGSGTTWTDVTGATQTLAVNNGYIADRGAGNVAFTLPVTAAIGDTIRIIGRQNGWTVSQNASQQIIIGSFSSTVGVGGSIASTNAHDCVIMVCTATNNEWTVNSVVGNITIV